MSVMRTDRQKEASRLNGARSQGPKTTEGKARSARNSLTHGLTASRVVLECEDQTEFDAILAEHVEIFRPRNRIELTLVERMAASWWRHRRGISIETNRLDLYLRTEHKFNDRGYSEPQLLARAYDNANSGAGAVPSIERQLVRLNREYDHALQLLLKLQQRPDLQPPQEDVQNEPEPTEPPSEAPLLPNGPQILQNEPEAEQTPSNQQPDGGTRRRVIAFIEHLQPPAA